MDTNTPRATTRMAGYDVAVFADPSSEWGVRFEARKHGSAEPLVAHTREGIREMIRAAEETSARAQGG